MSDYVTVDQLRDLIGSETSNFESVAQRACTTASRAVDSDCERYFYQDAAVSDREFRIDDYFHVCVDDISTTTGLVVATDDTYTGAFGTTWTISTDFLLEPRNPSASGVTRPWTELCATGTRVFPPPYLGRTHTVKVTAKWGWVAVPDEISTATLLAAASIFKQKDGVVLGIDGIPRYVRDNPTVKELLGPYKKNAITVA